MDGKLSPRSAGACGSPKKESRRESPAAWTLLEDEGVKEQDKQTTELNKTTKKEQGDSPTSVLSLSSRQLMKYQETQAFLSLGAQYPAPAAPSTSTSNSRDSNRDSFQKSKHSSVPHIRADNDRKAANNNNRRSLPPKFNKVDPDRMAAASLALSSHKEDELVKEQEKSATFASLKSPPSNPRSSKRSLSKNKSGSNNSFSTAMQENSFSTAMEDFSMSESALKDNIQQCVPKAPLEGNDEDVLMKMIAQRSRTALAETMDGSLQDLENPQPKEESQTFHDSKGLLTDESYYTPRGQEVDDRSNIKQPNELPEMMPGAYAGAPGAMPRRVRSICYTDVGISRGEEEKRALEEYLGKETQRLAKCSQHTTQQEDCHGCCSKSQKGQDPEQPLVTTAHHNHHHASTKRDSVTSEKSSFAATGSMELALRRMEGLVEARAVCEESQRNIVGQANAYDGPSEEEKQQLRQAQKRKFLGATLCFVLGIPLLIVLILWGSEGLDQEADTVVILTPAPSSAASNAPTVAPTSWAVALPEYSMKTIWENPDSPQAKAYRWIQEDPNLLEYSDDKNQQRFALVAFYHGTAGDTWTMNEDWLSYDVDECDWFSKYLIMDTGGGICDEEGNYLSLVLTLNGLAGSLVPELTLLTNLRTIDVATNSIEGALPTELGLMIQLHELSLDVNQLTATLPSEVGLIHDLEILLVHGNELTGPIPTEFGQLIHLADFEAGGQGLSGTLPSELGLMTSLTALALHENAFTGSIPLELWNLSDLRYMLQLNSNALTGTLAADVGRLTNLELLRIYGTQMTGSLPSELGEMTSLTYLDLCCGYFSQSLPNEVGQLTNLNTIYLDNSQFSGTIPTELGHAKKLRLLSLPSNNFTGSIPTELSNLHELDQLFLYFNSLTGPIPSQFGLLGNLTTMDIEINELTSTIPTELFQMSSIEVLWMGKNYLASTIPSQVGLLSRTLTKFSVDWTAVFGFLPPEIGHLSLLRELYLGPTNMVGPLRSELGLLTSLEKLSVDLTFFAGTIPIEIENLGRSIHTINMNDTFLTGTVPAGLCAVPELHFGCSDRLCGCDCPCVS